MSSQAERDFQTALTSTDRKVEEVEHSQASLYAEVQSALHQIECENGRLLSGQELDKVISEVVCTYFDRGFSAPEAPLCCENLLKRDGTGAFYVSKCDLAPPCPETFAQEANGCRCLALEHKWEHCRVLVYKNGLLLNEGTDYSFESDYDLVFPNNLASGDIVKIIYI